MISGVLVGGGWCYQLWEWAGENWGSRARRGRAKSTVGEGMLHGRKEEDEEGEEGG